MSFKTSRKNLYDSESEVESEPLQLPNIEFELIEVNSEKDQTKDEEMEPEEPEEFAFPLFSAPAANEVMTVTLKEDEMEEEIINERPESYYRAIYSERERDQFKLAAVDASYVIAWSQTLFPDSEPRRVVNLKEFNERIDHERKRHRKRRAGKKKRENIIICRERRNEREKEIKKLRREQQMKEKKKKFKKWNGAPVKTKEKIVAKPKYRTE